MNLNTLRSMAKAAQAIDGDVILTVDEARAVIAEAERMAGGNHDLVGDRDTQIAELKLKVDRMSKKLDNYRASEPVDKIKSLLPGG